MENVGKQQFHMYTIYFVFLIYYAMQIHYIILLFNHKIFQTKVELRLFLLNCIRVG